MSGLLKEILNKNKSFFIPYGFVFLIVTVSLLTNSKTQLHIFTNRYYCNFSDVFFKYLTYLGSGFFVIAMAIVLLVISLRKSIFVLSTYLTAGFIVQFLKIMIFSNMVRPAKFFEGIYNLHLINGVKMHYYHAFPSGHAATAFALFLCFALFADKNTIKFFYFTLSLLVAYSRVYLSQHFLADVFFGSIFGVLTTLMLYKPVYLSSGNWMDKDFRQLIKKRNNA